MQYIQYNWLYLLIGIFIYLIMLCISRPDITYQTPTCNNVNKHIYFFFLLYTINSIFGLWAEDTYHIWDEFVVSGMYYNFKIEGYEAIYNWLASVTGNNYFLWRFIVWTPACMFMYYSAKRLSLLNKNLLVSLALFGGFLAFTRGMLGHAMLIYGLIILGCSYHDRKTIGSIIGLLIIGASYFFHKSMYINILFAILALISFGKNLIRISIPLFPLAIILASMTVDYILAGEIEVKYGEGVGGVGDRTMDYLQGEKNEINTFGQIGQFILLTPIYYVMYYLYNRIYVKDFLKHTKYKALFKYLYRLTYVAIYISSAYFFLDTSQWISQRFRYMAFFPLVFILGKILSMEQRSNGYIKLLILLQLFAFLFQYLMKIRGWYAL